MDPPVMSNNKRIFLSPPKLSGKEKDYILEAINSNYIAPLGPQVDAFENALAHLTQRKYALSVSSGTAAMHLALHSLGVKAGDYVLASTLTFIGSIAPIHYLGAHPIFIDSSLSTWNMDPDLLENAIEAIELKGQKVAAVVPTDIYGQCADYDPIESICRHHRIPLIIDSAESLGAIYDGRPAGSTGDAAIMSFNGNKIITTSGGGSLLTDNPDIARHARKLSQQAREPVAHFEHKEIGYNYRMSNISAAVGLGQLEDLNWRLNKKLEIFNNYNDLLGDHPGITFMPEAVYGKCTRWLTVCIIDPIKFGSDREEIRLALESRNIESRPVWKPMHLQPAFKDVQVFGGAVSERLYDQGLCLPSGLDLSVDDQKQVADTVLSCQRS